jgi:hypothetical protein
VISNLPAGGISIFAGDRQKLVSANIAIRNSIISDFAFMSRTYKPAVAVAGVGNEVSGNIIANGPHVGIMFGGNNQRIANNELFNVVTETDDASVIYSGRDWTQRGHIIEDNFIHDIGSDELKSAVASAVYLDDQYSGTTVRHNLISGGYYSVFLGGGRDNHVDNNLFLSPKAAGVSFDDRGLTWQRAFENTSSELMQRLVAVDISSPIWRTQYPTLFTMMTDNPGAPLGNTVSGNSVTNAPIIQYHSDSAKKYLTAEKTTELSSVPADLAYATEDWLKEHPDWSSSINERRNNLRNLPFYARSGLSLK